ncbi:glycosyltransferase family 2 protein [Kribbia dieselivorans]|uniref:glycosyltransferase family 2 protein n=1 Tax=Kribbia dieselivorans TaxID=331526 RepID=UPI0008384323|nr:glycosyltransferase family 2 protein [Kribbia dieselivorans]
MPLISVILPVRDGSRTLGTAVRSTLRSMPKDAELLILDDGSVDHPERLVEEVSDARIRMLRNDRSVGVGAGLQQLLDATDSRYVFRMDADDVCLPGRFHAQLAALDGADLAFTPIIKFKDGSRVLRPGLPLPITAEAMPLHLLVHNPLCHPTMAARREALATAGGYRGVQAEDHDLWLRSLRTGLRLVRTSVPALAYRSHAQQISTEDGFIQRAHANPLLRDAYREFVTEVFKVDATWLDTLWSGESGTPRMKTDLSPLKLLLEDHARKLPLIQRIILGRTTRLLSQRVEVAAAHTHTPTAEEKLG